MEYGFNLTVYNVTMYNTSCDNCTTGSNDTNEETGKDMIDMREALLNNSIYQLSFALIRWCFPIIITIGTIGNIFSFIVMLQREMRQTSTFFYLMILALADTLVLFVSAFKTLIRVLYDFEMLHISSAACKIIMFLIYVSLQMSAWLIVAVTVERFIVVWFPLKAPSICSTKRAKLTTLSIGLILCALNAHLFWTADLINGGRTCAMQETNKFLYHSVPWIHLALSSLIPLVSLLVFNSLIIVSLVKHRQIIKSQMTRDDRRTRYNHRRLAVTLLSVSFIWIFTATPSALFTVLPFKDRTIQGTANTLLIKVICYILMYINHSINFFLYCITGQTFRRAFVKFICRMCTKRHKQKPKLRFRASRSGSRQETSFPLMENMYIRGSKTYKHFFPVC